jgi:hypothetical protein
MIKTMLISIASKLTSILTQVDESKDTKSATVVPSMEPLDSQPTFLYTKESLDNLKKVFPIKLYKDKDTKIEELAFSAGQQDIINYIERRLGKEKHKVIR